MMLKPGKKEVSVFIEKIKKLQVSIKRNLEIRLPIAASFMLTVICLFLQKSFFMSYSKRLNYEFFIKNI